MPGGIRAGCGRCCCCSSSLGCCRAAALRRPRATRPRSGAARSRQRRPAACSRGGALAIVGAGRPRLRPARGPSTRSATPSSGSSRWRPSRAPASGRGRQRGARDSSYRLEVAVRRRRRADRPPVRRSPPARGGAGSPGERHAPPPARRSGHRPLFPRTAPTGKALPRVSAWIPAAEESGDEPGADLAVDIVIDNYNYGRYLPTAIESACAQTHGRVTRDRRRRRLQRRLARGAERYKDRVTVVLKENGGQASALNVGVERCQRRRGHRSSTPTTSSTRRRQPGLPPPSPPTPVRSRCSSGWT